MTIARGVGWLAGRCLRLGVRDEWGGFKRGLQTGLVGVAVVAGGAGWLASERWNDLAPIMPPRASAPAPVATHRLAGRLDSNGQCYVRGTVERADMTFMVDSGASLPTLSRDHIRRLGVDPAQLNYDQTTSTANGIGHAARVTIGEVSFGGKVLRNVPALVNYAPLDYPLLGTSLLQQMHLEMGRGACALRW
jgi:clan AA aspartic protease (TIGR02281 family)